MFFPILQYSITPGFQVGKTPLSQGVQRISTNYIDDFGQVWYVSYYYLFPLRNSSWIRTISVGSKFRKRAAWYNHSKRFSISHRMDSSIFSFGISYEKPFNLTFLSFTCPVISGDAQNLIDPVFFLNVSSLRWDPEWIWLGPSPLSNQHWPPSFSIHHKGSVNEKRYQFHE